jgi:hypothetical protein
MSVRIHLATFGVCLCAAASASAAQPGGVCSGPPVSAQNQYCENIPSATGNHGPQGSSPADTGPGSIASTLPAGVRHAITRSDPLSPRQRLLALPPRIAASSPPNTKLDGSGASVLSLSLPLVLALVAGVLAMVLAAERKRRQRTVNAA